MVGLGGHTFFWALCGDGELDFIAVGVSSTGKREQHLSSSDGTVQEPGVLTPAKCSTKGVPNEEG